MPAFLKHMRAALVRELKRMGSQPMYLVLLGVLPLVSFAFFAVLLEQGVAHDIPIAVLDEDHSALSRKLTQMVDDTPTALVSYEITSMEEGERMMREGKILAIVQIPDRFEKNILSNTQTHLESYISGTNITANGLLAKDLQTAAATFSAGIQIQVLTKQGLTERQAMAQLMPVRFSSHVLFNPYINYGYYLAPSFIPMMLMIFTVMATIFALGTELKHSTARDWYDTAGGSISAALAGKLLPITGALFVLAQIMFLILFEVVGVPLNGSFALLQFGTLLFILGYQSISMLLVAIVSNLRLALSLGGGYSVLAFTFSGLTFPVMAMSPAMQALSRMFPFTYYTDLMIDQALRGAPVVCSLKDTGALALFVIIPLLALPRLRQTVTEPKFWGRL